MVPPQTGKWLKGAVPIRTRTSSAGIDSSIHVICDRGTMRLLAVMSPTRRARSKMRCSIGSKTPVLAARATIAFTSSSFTSSGRWRMRIRRSSPSVDALRSLTGQATTVETIHRKGAMRVATRSGYASATRLGTSSPNTRLQ